MRSTEEQLAWEGRYRPRAGVTAILASLLTLGGGILSGLTFQDVPRSSLQEGLALAAEEGPVGSLPSLRAPFFEWYRENFSELLLGALLTGLGALAVAGTLMFLALAVAARRPQFPRAMIYVPLVGGVLLAIARVVVALGNDQLVDDVLAGPQTVDAVADLARGGLLTAGQLIELVGTLALGLGLIMISLNAMRTGLLTRFMGVLGIIAGVLLAFPVFGGPLPVVQGFWLLALGVLLIGRWPGGAPPAWAAGTAMPWPSSAEMRAAREAGRAPSAPEGDDAPPAAPGSRKKRKRRR